MNKLQLSYRILFFIALILILANSAFAATGSGVGQVASNILEPVNVFSDFVYTACFGIGTAFVFTSIIKYFEHRRSPLMVPISTVVFLLIAGIVLILLPFLSFFMGSGVHYSLLK